jgi:hypothetical protein
VTAVTTFVARYGKSPVFTADDRYIPFAEPDIYGHLVRRVLTFEWEITAGKYGEPLAWGRALTQGGARWKAVAAAQRPGILGGAR